jgi:CheY-like chemotaxis protein
VIEDHADTAAALAKLLRNRAHHVLLADCCAAAERLAAWTSPAPHVAVGDIGLPDGDGAELLGNLKQARGCATIAFTGHGMPEDIERCRMANIDLHLLKPLQVDELIHAIESLGGRVDASRAMPSQQPQQDGRIG